MFDYKRIIKSRELRLRLINALGFIPDKPYLKLVYFIKNGKRLNLSHPVGFNEKLNWMKINDKHPEYTELVDKYAVRAFVKDRIGDKYLIPLYGVWNSFDEIDFESLPNQFVLKCTHDSGSVKIIRDKSKINISNLRAFFTSRLRINPFNLGREYPYKHVHPRIIAEQLMGGESIPKDYKFFCFNGVPTIMYVASDRDKDCKFTFFDMDFKRIEEIDYYIHPSSDEMIEKPQTFEKMKTIAKDLSMGMPFVRMDFYEVDGQLYFGEYTFFTGGGFYLFKPDSYEQYLGSLINVI